MSVSTKTDSKISEEQLSRLLPDISKSARNYSMEQYTTDLQRISDLYDVMPRKEERWAIEVEKLNQKYMESSKIFNIMEIDAENLNGAAKGVGNAFGSAFEKAVLQGKGFSNVIRGLEKELQSALFHSLITNPLNKFIQKKTEKGLEVLFGNGEEASNSGGNLFAKAMESIESWFGDTVPQADRKVKAQSVGKNNPDNLSPGFSGDSNPNVIVHMNISTPDAQSFRANQGEVLAEMNRALLRGQRNM